MGTALTPPVLSEFTLLERGYFPKELPPTFDSAEFASKIQSNIGAMPSTFTSAKLRGRSCLHNFARVGNLRRRLGIANPVLQYNLCKVIADNWPAFDGQIRASTLSQSYPIVGTSTERALPSFSPDLVRLRASHRATARFLLKTDITRFYHSIYTHSIPWALHTKSVAKKDRSLNLVGNLLDFWVRNGQDGQTLGLPIGPDTSLVLAELILSAVDAQLLGRAPRLRGLRFMDDYELTFASRSDMELALGYLQEAMADYELALSGEKTLLTNLPAEIDQNWVAELRDFEIRQTVEGQSTDLVRFFDVAYELSKSHPDKNVLSYGVGRLKSIQLEPDNWQLLQDLLFQAILAEPGTVALALAQLHHYQQSGLTVDLAKLVDVVNIQISYQAPIGHGSEVAWAIWAAIAFNLDISEPAAQAVSGMNDCVVALLCLDAANRGLIPAGLDTTGWQSSMNADELYGEQWLLAYEANIKGWLPTSADHVSSDPNFGWLKSLGVSFYDTQQGAPIMGAPVEY